MPPLVSVIMPTYNCAAYIISSVESVLSQTMEDWSLEIVDDLSTDNTAELLRPYIQRDRRIHYSCLPKNSGPAAARTEALRSADGRYVAFLDSDDLWYPEKLEKQIAFMEKNGAAFSCTAYRQMDPEGKDLHIVLTPPRKLDYRGCIRLSNPIGNLTAMYDQTVIGKLEVPPIRKRNDFALWLQVLKRTEYCYGMEDVLAVYRAGRPGSVSRKKLGQAKYHWQLYREIEGHSWMRSSCEMACWAFVKGTGIGLKRKRVP